MSIARRIAAMLIAAAVVVPATATSQRSSPGYSYRLTMTGRLIEPSGRSRDYLVMSGHALVTDKAGRLDVDQAAPRRGAIAGKDSYILYDSASMTIVVPKARQIVRLALANLEQELSPASAPAATISDVAVNVEKLGAGEPMLGMATTKYRITQDYKLASTGAPVKRSSTEHVVQELWIEDEKQGLRNPFAHLGDVHMAAASGELLTRTAEARSSIGRGMPLRIVTTTTSTSGRNAVTQTVSWMEVADLQAENIDDDILAAPTDYRVVDVNALAGMAQSGQASRASEPAKVARPATTGDAAAEAKGGFVKALHGMGRRP